VTQAEPHFYMQYIRWLQPLLTCSVLAWKVAKTAKDHPVAAGMAAVGAVGVCAPGVIVNSLLPLAGFGQQGVAAGKIIDTSCYVLGPEYCTLIMGTAQLT